MPRMPKTALKTFALEDTSLKTWFERDRAHVDLQDRKTGRTLIEFWDEDVEQLLEDGFLDRRNLHDSLYKYAVHLGTIKERAAMHHATRKKPPAQLDREIAEVLEGAATTSTVKYGTTAQLLDRLRSARQAAFDATRLKSRAAKQHGLSAEYWAKVAERNVKAKRYDVAHEDLERAEAYIVRAARATGFR